MQPFVAGSPGGQGAGSVPGPDRGDIDPELVGDRLVISGGDTAKWFARGLPLHRGRHEREGQAAMDAAESPQVLARTRCPGTAWPSSIPGGAGDATAVISMRPAELPLR